MWRKIPDSFATGILLAVVCIVPSYFILSGVRLLITNYYGNSYMLAEPRVQLFSILINVLLFRFMVVKFEKDKTGRGILFFTVLMSLIYFILFYRFHFRMS